MDGTVLLAGGAAGQQLKIQSEDGAVKLLAASELAALPHRVLQVSDHDGKPLNFDAIPLKAVLEKAGVLWETHFAASGWLLACWCRPPTVTAR